MIQHFVLVDGQLLLFFRILELPWLLASWPLFSGLSGWIIFCQGTFLVKGEFSFMLFIIMLMVFLPIRLFLYNTSVLVGLSMHAN